MRYLAFCFCVLAAACAGKSPTSPTASASQIGEGIVTTSANGGAELPFKGTYEGEEKEPDPTVPSKHHLEATGTVSHLGRFTVTADWTVTGGGPIETSSTWTADGWLRSGDLAYKVPGDAHIYGNPHDSRRHRSICQRFGYLHGCTDPRPLDFAFRQFRHDRRND